MSWAPPPIGRDSTPPPPTSPSPSPSPSFVSHLEAHAKDDGGRVEGLAQLGQGRLLALPGQGGRDGEVAAPGWGGGGRGRGRGQGGRPQRHGDGSGGRAVCVCVWMECACVCACEGAGGWEGEDRSVAAAAACWRGGGGRRESERGAFCGGRRVRASRSHPGCTNAHALAAEGVAARESTCPLRWAAAFSAPLCVQRVCGLLRARRLREEGAPSWARRSRGAGARNSQCSASLGAMLSGYVPRASRGPSAARRGRTAAPFPTFLLACAVGPISLASLSSLFRTHRLDEQPGRQAARLARA